MNAPPGETRKPVTVDLEVEFEGFSGKERFPDALMYPKGVLVRTRYLKPVGTPASFIVLGRAGDAPVAGRGQVVFSRWQDQGPRRPAGLGLRIDEWDGDSEARVNRWFEAPSQFDLVDAQSVPASEVAAVAAAAAAQDPMPPAKSASISDEIPLPRESAPPVARWMAEDVPASMPDLSLRFGKPAAHEAAEAASPREASEPEAPPEAAMAEVVEPFRPVWEPVANGPAPAASAGLAGDAPRGGLETVRIPRGAAWGDSLPQAGSHVTRQEDAGEPEEPFRPVWSPPTGEAPTLSDTSGAPPEAAMPPMQSMPLAVQSPPSLGEAELPVGRDGNVVWLPPARPRLMPWILAGVLAVVAAGGGYWIYLTRFAAKPAAVFPSSASVAPAPAAVTQVVEPPPASASLASPAGGAAPSASGAPPPGPEPVPAPATSEPARRFAALTGVSWTVDGEELVVRLSLDGTATARDVQQFRVSGPTTREVIKLRGCRPSAVRRFEVGDARLRSVRVGEQPGGDLHVVLDLADARVAAAPLTIGGATLTLRLRR
jgi:hypothetical protein